MLPGQHLPVSSCNTAGFRLVFALVILIVTWLTLTPSPGVIITSINDKLAHMVAFFVLAFLAHGSWPDSAFDWKFILPLAAYGLILELLQNFIPARYFSVLDILADLAGIILYILLIPLISRMMKNTHKPAS